MLNNKRMSRSMVPKVSIGLPVYNGASYLGQAIESILKQRFADLELIVSDNASTDETAAICEAYSKSDSRVRYLRSERNLGAAANYTLVFDKARGQYFKWAAHDDVCLPDFLGQCVAVLDRDPSVVLCHARTQTIDPAGRLGKKWKSRPDLASHVPHRRLRDVLTRQDTFPIWGLMRTEILGLTPLLGPYPEHDRPLLAELSLYGRFFEISEFLFHEREHSGRSVRRFDFRRPHEAVVWYDPSQAGTLIFPAWKLLREHLAAVRRAPLALRDRGFCYQEVLQWCRSRRGEFVRDLLVAADRLPLFGRLLRILQSRLLKRTWSKETRWMLQELNSLLTPGEDIVFVDGGSFDPQLYSQWQAVPFPEREGRYWGLPSNDQSAISELERLRALGARKVVFTWPTFWWLQHYNELDEHLRGRYPQVFASERLQLYDLRARPQHAASDTSA